MQRIISLMYQKKKIILVLITVLFGIASIGYSLYLGNVLRYPDERWYFNDYAQNLAKRHMFSRDGISPTAFHPPVYPLLLGGLVMLGLGVTAVRLLNFLFLFLTWLLLFFWLEKRFPGPTSLFALLLVLGYPVLFYTAGTLYPQTLGAFFFVLALIFFWQEPFRWYYALLGGISMGLAVLTVPTFLFVPFFMLVFALAFRRSLLRGAFLLFVFTFATIAPWVIRNYLVFNRFALLSTNFGINLLIGNNPSTTPNSGVNVDISAIVREAEHLDEFQANQFYALKAVRFILENPRHYLALYFLKFLNYFNFRNELATVSESSMLKDLIMLVTYGTLMLIALIRLVLIHRYPLEKDELFMILCYLASAFVIAIFFTRIRFRLPFDYLLIVLDARFLGKLVADFCRKKCIT